MADKIEQKSRRDFLKKAGYTAPAILTISAAPAFARQGSCQTGGGGHHDGNHHDGNHQGGDHHDGDHHDGDHQGGDHNHQGGNH